MCTGGAGASLFSLLAVFVWRIIRVDRERLQAGRRRSFARQGLSDEASRSLVLVGVCGDDSALWGYGRKPPLTHTLPHYHVTWRIPAAPPLGDAFDLARPPLPVLRTGAARRLLKALCPFWEGCCCCRLRATGNAITPSPRDGGSYRVALQQYKSFWQDSTLDLWHSRSGRARWEGTILEPGNGPRE